MGLKMKVFVISGLEGCVCCNCLGFGNLRGDEETGWEEKMGIGKGRRGGLRALNRVQSTLNSSKLGKKTAVTSSLFSVGHCF